jgi:hypothetical protein
LLSTDFLILFFTEALFYGGVGIFVLLIDKVWRPLQQVAPKSYIWSKTRFFRISSVTTMVLSLIIPLLTMGMVWPWTGPAASATLAPYLVGLVVQFAFEQYARHRKSPSWPVIPIIFKVMWFLIYPAIAWILKLPFLVIIKCDLVEMLQGDLSCYCLDPQDLSVLIITNLLCIC